MYSSLERLDIGSTNKKVGPMTYLTQTDHRDAETITGEAALSVIFAITRCLLAHEVARQDGTYPYRVVYRLAGEAPAFLRHVVAAAGASVVSAQAAYDELPELVPRYDELPSL